MGNGRWDSSGGDEIEDVYYPCCRSIVFVEELSQCLVRVARRSAYCCCIGPSNSSENVSHRKLHRSRSGGDGWRVDRPAQDWLRPLGRSSSVTSTCYDARWLHWRRVSNLRIQLL